MVDLDEISNAFAEYMDVNDDDLAVVPCESLRSLLEAVGLAPSLAEPLGREMDPEGTGYIEFEPFVNTVVNYLAEDEEHRGDEDCQRTYALLNDASNGKITEQSLQEVAAKLRFSIPAQDIQKMIQIAKATSDGGQGDIKSGVTPAEFAKLWGRLNNMFGAEVGP